MKTLSIVGLLLFAVVACGQKGPLYMPKNVQSQPQSPVKATANTDAKSAIDARKVQKTTKPDTRK